VVVVRGVGRLLLTVVMNVLLIAAGLLLARIVIAFFGRFDAIQWASRFMDLTAPMVPALKLGSMPSPYAGIYDFNAGAALVGVLAVEWLLALVRRFAR
jgi:hypothetical protein